MFEQINTSSESADPSNVDTTRTRLLPNTQSRHTMEEHRKFEEEAAASEAKLDQELEETFEKIQKSLKNKINAATDDIKRIKEESAQQWFWERAGSNSASQIAEFQAMADAASTFLERIENNYSEAQLSIFPEKRSAFLQELKDLAKVDEKGVPIMGPDGQFVSELLRSKPNFAKLQGEFEAMEYKLNLAEQGLQYSQTVLEIAASYAGPPGLVAVMLPKYIIQLSTGQSTPTNVSLQIFEDVVSSYIGSGKFAKAVLQKLGPYAGKLIEAFQASDKSGWTKETIKSVVLQCIEIFRDTELQNIFAWGKEQVTGEEGQYMSFKEVAGGQILGKAIGKGLDVSGAGTAIRNVATGEVSGVGDESADSVPQQSPQAPAQTNTQPKVQSNTLPPPPRRNPQPSTPSQTAAPVAAVKPTSTKRELPPPPGKKMNRMNTEARDESAPSTPKKSEVVKQLNEDPDTAKFLSKYANRTPEQLALSPDLEMKLAACKENGQFGVQHYYEGYGSEWMDFTRVDPSKRPAGFLDSMRMSGSTGPAQTMLLRNGHKDIPFREDVILTDRVGYIPKDKVNLSGQPTNMVLPKVSSSEAAKAIIYKVSGEEYFTNLLTRKGSRHSDLAARGNNSPLRERVSEYKPTASHNTVREYILEDTAQAYLPNGKIDKAFYSTARPGNSVSVKVTLPSSEADALYKYFQSHPEEIRPFFLRGGESLMIYHLPPPYAGYDSEGFLLQFYNDKNVVPDLTLAQKDNTFEQSH